MCVCVGVVEKEPFFRNKSAFFHYANGNMQGISHKMQFSSYERTRLNVEFRNIVLKLEML